MFLKLQRKFERSRGLVSPGLVAVVLAVIIGLGVVVYLWNARLPAPVATEQGTMTAALSDIYKDVVVSKSYRDLPSSIRGGLGYNSNEVKAVVYAEASLVTKAASFVISVSDAISRLSGIAIGGTQSRQELKQALETTVTQELITKGGVVGEVVVTLYKVNEAGELVQLAVKTAKIAKNAASAPLIAAQAVGIVLDAEMTYINNNLSGGLKNLWSLNPLSRERLKLYIVFVSAFNKKGMEDMRGVRFYYYNDKTRGWVNYYTDITGADVLLRK